MKRIFLLGLMASTLLSTVPAAAQRSQGHGRGEAGSVNRSRSNPSADSGQRDRSAPRPAQAQRAAPPVRAAPPQRAAPAVRNTRVPASNAPRANWRRQGEDLARPVGNTDNRPSRQGAGRRGVAPTPTTRPPVQPAQQANRPPRQHQTGTNDAQRDGRNWNRRDNDRRDGNWNRNDNRNDHRWTGNDARRGNDRPAGNRWRDNDRNDRSHQADRNHHRRLNERDRWSDTRRWDNHWRNNHRYDWQHYRARNRNVYHLPAYYAPYGWNYGYRPFSIGIYLNDLLFASDYWIDDPYSYRLPPAYGPLRWIRYYDDALLVDTRDGYVVDVIHNFFW